MLLLLLLLLLLLFAEFVVGSCGVDVMSEDERVGSRAEEEALRLSSPPANSWREGDVNGGAMLNAKKRTLTAAAPLLQSVIAHTLCCNNK